MAKNHNRKPAKHNDPMGTATTVFLAGCFAELYLLMIRRFYVNGTLDQVLAWHSALPCLIMIGAAVLLAYCWHNSPFLPVCVHSSKPEEAYLQEWQ